MTYDLLIKNGLIVDGSGLPAFSGDIGVSEGRIAAIGKLNGAAKRTIDAQGLAVAPGFIDNHCHFDAQVLWDPSCSSSCFHGATTVIFGNCSLGLAPVRPQDRKAVAGMLSYVEAIPMDVLEAGVPWDWVSFPQYLDKVSENLGLNVGVLLGHSPLRYYVMGEASIEDGRAASPEQLEEMKGLVKEAMQAGALGLSMTRERAHFDLDGRHISASCAPDAELLALAETLSTIGGGVIQCGGGTASEFENQLMSRLADISGRRVLYNALLQSERMPGLWKKHLALAERQIRAGSRAFPMCTPNPIRQRFTMHNCQLFRGMPHWHPILTASDDEKLRAYADPAIRRTLRADLAAPQGPSPVFSGRWDLLVVEGTASPKHRALEGLNIEQIAAQQNKDVVDAFLDLVVADRLDTQFEFCDINFEPEAVAEIITSPYTVIGLADSGAHVQFDSGAGFSTRLLGYWVREQGVMSLEEAVRQLTHVPAMMFEIDDRGLIKPGMAADLVVFNPDTVGGCRLEVAHDFPNNGWRLLERANGIEYSVVNGTVFMERGEYTDSQSGRVLRSRAARSH